MSRVNEEKTIDPIGSLPAELKSRILSFLTPVDLSRAAQVNRSWRAIADDDLLWKALVDASKEKSEEHLKEAGSYKQLFIKSLDYRQNAYLASDEAGRRLCKAKARQHFRFIKKSRRWNQWEKERYDDGFKALHKDHHLVTQVLDILCKAPHRGQNNPDDCASAFNYLYEQNALNKTTLAAIADCLSCETLSEKFDVEYYAYSIVTFYRANILSKDNLDAVKASFNPHKRLAEAFDIVLDTLKYEPQITQKATFPAYRDRLIALSETCDEPIRLVTYAECMVNLSTNGIRLSDPDHAVIYDELLKFDAVTADCYSYSFVILHKAGLLIGPGCKLLRDILLGNERDDGDWRAEEIIVNYVNRSLMPYVSMELEKLSIDPGSVTEALRKLDRLPIDFERVRNAVEECTKLNMKIDLDAVRTKLKKLNQWEESDTDSGIGAVEDNDSPASSFLSKPDIVKNIPSPTGIQTQSDSEPLKQFISLSSKLVSPDNAARILHALQTQDVHSFETVQGLLLNQCISREYFLKKNCGAAAIADLYDNKRLAFFIRIAAEMDTLLYENKLSLIKRLPADDRAEAADTYLHNDYRPEVFSAIKDYLQKTSSNKNDYEKLSKTLKEATERFFHNKSPSKEGDSPVKSLAEDRTRWSQARREFMMVTVNFLLHMTIMGIVLNVINKVQTGNWFFFTETKSKEKLNKIKKTILDDVISCRGLQN